MGTKQFIGLYTELFRGREEFYAIRKEFPDRAIYVPSTYDKDSEYIREVVEEVVEDIGSAEYGEEAVRAHIFGEHFLGVYPIQADSAVNFFVLDFDGGEEDHNPWTEALHQHNVLRDGLNVDTYLERSRSGKGYHVWGFLEEPVPAARVRHALKPWLLKANTFDRMFPNQDKIGKGLSHGNLIALPLYGPNVSEGGGVFVGVSDDGKPLAVLDQKDFLADVKKIPISLMDELYDEAGDYVAPRDIKVREEDVEQLRGIHKVVHPVFGCEWIRWQWEHPDEVMEPEWYALACQFAQLEEGREEFHKFSERSDRYDEETTDRKFDQALRQNKPYGCRYIRENLGGPPCLCDERFPGEVYHPYELAHLSFHTLIASIELDEDVIDSTAYDSMDDFVEYLEAVEDDPTIGQGIPFGVDVIDEHFGFRGGEITLLAARNSLGKTAIALFSLSQLVLIHKKAGKLFSLEMTRRQIMMRLVADLAGVSQKRMKAGLLINQDWERIREAKELLKGVPLAINDMTTDLDQMINSAAEFVLEHGQESVIYVDYLQIMRRFPGENEQDNIYRVVSAFKQFAKVLNCHVVLLSQLNREADGADMDTNMRDSMLRGCLAADTRILRADTNTEITIGELAKGEEIMVPIWTMDEDCRMVRRVIWEAFSSGVKSIYRLRLSNGREVRATANHPFFTPEGKEKWTPLGELSVGDFVAYVVEDEVVDYEVWCREVVSIEEDGFEEVFDATVPGTHNFVANGILVHNSDTQSYITDNILMLLGDKGPGTVERILKIHKQRNGEAGITVPLEFNQPLMQWGAQGTWLKIGAAYTNMQEYMDTPGGSPIAPPTFGDVGEEDEEYGDEEDIF